MGKIAIGQRLINISILLTSVLTIAVFLPANRSEAAVIDAQVVALDQVLVYNRYGAFNPAGMIFALRRDVVDKSTGLSEAEGAILSPGQVRLRDGKRPRPLVLRVNVGDELRIRFQNLLNPTDITDAANQAPGIQLPPIQTDQPITRNVGIHINGTQAVGNIRNMGQKTGSNSSSYAAPGQSRTYRFLATKQGTFSLYNPAIPLGSEANIGSLSAGLFGALNVEPAGSEWYRSQITRQELDWAQKRTPAGEPVFTPGGHPVLAWDKRYPPEAGPAFAGIPILKIRGASQIYHSDLHAVITGPGRGNFPPGVFPVNPTYPGRDRPFREVTVVFHDEIKAVQAFPGFYSDPSFHHTLASVKDGFAINYGTGGIGSEIIANRLGVGPPHECTECKYEEFFLTSWAVGDPAMIVDVPANAGLEALTPGTTPDPLSVGPKASKAFYPDDPANVIHSYMNDRLIMRNLHFGKEHHIFHQHGHQWLFTPDDDNSNYLDAQAIGPGSSFSYEIAYGGSGNRNKTPGDHIFHCHFYPHFAQGMWALWRVHDVFETGTQLDGNGIPMPGSRALPDAEILSGTPIPAVIPVPNEAMPPMPQADVEIVGGQPVITPIPNTSGNPGYPFFIPGIAGHRPPTPPLDLVRDGGLPRHVITGGTTTSNETPLNFNKKVDSISAVQLAESGQPVELAAMNFHAQLFHDSFFTDGTPAQFEANGLPPAMGAPYAEPCRSDGTAYYGGSLGTLVGNPRTYKAAAIELNVQLNKVGWHFDQQRILALEDDVAATLSGSRPPEPFVMRANTNDCIDFDHTNLVPNHYRQDDYQVETPTDVIGQHIHLVKFDITSADGAANGFNYEDGTFSPEEVVERIDALNIGGGLLELDGITVRNNSNNPLTPTSYMGHSGTRTTRQRWYVDPTLNNAGEDRGLGNVFTHDHLGPSTHQQVGLYATLLIEPEGSTWRDPETGVAMGTRADGGPTSWRADILTPNVNDSFREFYLEFADYQLAYTQEGRPISPPGIEAAGLPFLVERACPPPFPLNGPCPEAISASDNGIQVVNYRSEPLGLRVRDPGTNLQVQGPQGDLSFALASIPRVDNRLNRQPFYSPLTAGVGDVDPFTPMLRAYNGDKINVRVQVGAHEEGHVFSINGLKWLQQYASKDSGYRNAWMMGISEQFQLQMPALVDSNPAYDKFGDYFYTPNASTEGLWAGSWGLMRAYETSRADLQPLPNNSMPVNGLVIGNADQFTQMCPNTAPRRHYDVTAISVSEHTGIGTLTYNSRRGPGGTGPLHDPSAMMFIMTEDFSVSRNKIKPGTPMEPLVLRAAAGECIEVVLRNRLPNVAPDLLSYNMLPFLIEDFNTNQMRPSNSVGLHPQLVSYNVKNSDGANIGKNQTQTVAPGGVKTYRWYAGDVRYNATTQELEATPVEYGGVNLMSSDPIKHQGKGLIGALVIEPESSTWIEDPGTRTSATVFKQDLSSYREFIVVYQDDVSLRFNGNEPLPPIAEADDAEDTGHKAINYRTEPMFHRLGFAPTVAEGITRNVNFTNATSNVVHGGQDPEVPVFTANRGEAVRFHVLKSGGHMRNSVFSLAGHIWPQHPYFSEPGDPIGSTKIADEGQNNWTFWHGEQMGIGPHQHFDIIPEKGAGGVNAVPGDYLIRDMAPDTFNNGAWAIFRVK